MPIFTLRNAVPEDGFVGKRVSFTQDTMVRSKSELHM